MTKNITLGAITALLFAPKAGKRVRRKIRRHYEDARDAIDFEKRLKRWRRAWKIRLIEEMNPEWRDLWPELMGHGVSGPLSNLDGVPDKPLRGFPG